MTGEVDVGDHLAEDLRNLIDGCSHPCPGVVAPRHGVLFFIRSLQLSCEPCHPSIEGSPVRAASDTFVAEGTR